MKKFAAHLKEAMKHLDEAVRAKLVEWVRNYIWQGEPIDVRDVFRLVYEMVVDTANAAPSEANGYKLTSQAAIIRLPGMNAAGAKIVFLVLQALADSDQWKLEKLERTVRHRFDKELGILLRALWCRGNGLGLEPDFVNHGETHPSETSWRRLVVINDTITLAESAIDAGGVSGAGHTDPKRRKRARRSRRAAETAAAEAEAREIAADVDGMMES